MLGHFFKNRLKELLFFNYFPINFIYKRRFFKNFLFVKRFLREFSRMRNNLSFLWTTFLFYCEKTECGYSEKIGEYYEECGPVSKNLCFDEESETLIILPVFIPLTSTTLYLINTLGLFFKFPETGQIPETKQNDWAWVILKYVDLVVDLYKKEVERREKLLEQFTFEDNELTFSPIKRCEAQNLG